MSGDVYSMELAGGGSVAQIADIALAGAGPTVIQGEDLGKAHAFLVPQGYQLTVKDFAEYLPTPRRAAGRRRVVRDEKDLVRLCEELGAHPTVYADPVTRSVVAILNDDVDKDSPGWRDDTITLGLVETEEWKAWKAANGELFPQEAFAEFIEDWRRTVVDPDDATMLEIAQTLHATVGVKAKSSRRLRDGNRQVQWEESTTTTAGDDGKVEIPEVFTVALVPWKGRDVTPIKMQARLRIRLNGGNVLLGFKLVDVDARMDEAFEALLAPIRDSLPVVMGTP